MSTVSKIAKKSAKKTKAEPKPALPAAPPAVIPAEVGPEDTIAYNRACAPIAETAIPAVPAGYRPTDFEHRRRFLRLLSGDLRAEAILALAEIIARAPTLQQDLGELAPSPETANALFTRIQETGKSIASQEALLHFHREIEDIALSDALQLLEAAFKEYQHRLDRFPQLAQRYTALERLFRARSAAISEGMARAKTTKPKGRS